MEKIGIYFVWFYFLEHGGRDVCCVPVNSKKTYLWYLEYVDKFVSTPKVTTFQVN